MTDLALFEPATSPAGLVSAAPAPRPSAAPAPERVAFSPTSTGHALEDARRAVAAARQSGRGLIPRRDSRGRPTAPRIVVCNPPRFAWLRCRRCPWRLKIALSALELVIGEDGQCPECKRRDTPAARRAVAAHRASVVVERLVSR